MLHALPFITFREAAAFDLEVEVSCRCQRRVVVDGASEFFRDRPIMGSRFTCTTILPHGLPCAASPSVYIRRRGRAGWTMADHSKAMRARHVDVTVPSMLRTFADVVQRGEVAHLYDRGCVPSYSISMVEFDEPPWDRFLAQRIGQFACPGCRRPLIMHLHHGPGTPGTERFKEIV